MKPIFLLFLFLSTAAFAAPVPLQPLETVAIQEGGRKKPFSTFATETLQSLSGRASYSPESAVLKEQGGTWTAMRVVAALWFAPEPWLNEPMILVNFKPLKTALGLDENTKRFSFNTLSTNEAFRKLMGEVRIVRQRDANAKLSRIQQEVVQVGNRLTLFEELEHGHVFALVPNPKGGDTRWTTPEEAAAFYPGSEGQAVVAAFESLRSTYGTEQFSSALTAFTGALASVAPDKLPPAWLLTLEHDYYKLHPFRMAWIFFALAAIFLLVTASLSGDWTRKAGWLIALIGLGFMIYGFVCRVLISGRAPVTNMYESIIWVAFGTIFFALIFAAVYKSKTFLLAACPLAVIALILADSQPTVLSSGIHPLVPVLRDNFWLTTHVLSITLSYAAFFLTLGVAHIILGKTIAGQKCSPVLYNYLYRTMQVGVLLLGTGTILGGVWANYSWGRFWDWDPKETWALIAFLSYIFLLHGRLAGYWGGFGLAVGSVIGFLCVVMAWYGVNFVLGAGLHSYGFGTGGFGTVIVVVSAELVFTAVAVIRSRNNVSRKPVAA